MRRHSLRRMIGGVVLCGAALLHVPTSAEAAETQPEMCTRTPTPWGICSTEPDINNCVVIDGELFCPVITYYKIGIIT